MAQSDTARPAMEITQLLQDYFDGLYKSDANCLRQVFHPKAHYACPTSGHLQYLSMPEYFSLVENRPSPHSRNEPRRDRILALEFSSPCVALARVECSIGNKLFSDLLALVKVDGRWQIISKIFHYQLME